MEEIIRKPTTQSGVYCIRNLYTKDAYIGSAYNIRARWKLHKTNLAAGKHHSKILQRAWDKYGADAFDFFVLEYCDKSQVLESEQFWLDVSTARYNIARVAGSRAGVKNSESHNKAIADKAKQRWANPEFKARVSKKLSAAHKGVPRPASKVDRVITAFGKTQRLQDWALETGIKRETIAYRLNAGYMPEDALATTKLRRGPKK